jgi:hypothetical protein
MAEEKRVASVESRKCAWRVEKSRPNFAGMRGEISKRRGFEKLAKRDFGV